MNLTIDKAELPETLALEDKWILSKYNDLVAAVTENIDKYELGLAVQKLYDFIWDNFCDWYIEIVKPRLPKQGRHRRPTKSAQKVLVLRPVAHHASCCIRSCRSSPKPIWQALPHEGEIGHGIQVAGV